MAVTRRKHLTDADRATWAAYARTVAALPGRDLPELPESGPTPVPASSHRHARVAIAAPPASTALAVGLAPGGLDAASWNKLRTGKMAPSRTLDLHGRTVQRAYHALYSFLLAAHADGVRCVEVITGRGSRNGEGAIRREFPLWLNQPPLRPLVLAASYPHAANTGSVRLLLRRTR